MKRPFVAVVSGYVIGLLLAGIFQPPPGVLFALALAVLATALFLRRFRPWLIWPLLALAGWANLASRTAIVAPDDLRALLGNDEAIVAVRGILTETPHLKMTGHEEPATERTLARIRVTALQRGKSWQPAAGTLMATVPGVLDARFFAGQPVEISGVIARPPPPLAEGLFDYRDYLETRGIFYQLRAASTNDWQLGAAAQVGPPWTDRFLHWSQRTLALGLPGEDEPLQLIWAMTLGWRTAFTSDVSEPFLRAGTIIHFVFHRMD